MKSKAAIKETNKVTSSPKKVVNVPKDAHDVSKITITRHLEDDLSESKKSMKKDYGLIRHLKKSKAKSY